MSDFLNNFSKEKYKKQVEESQEQVDFKTENSSSDISEGNEQEGLKLQLTGAAFEEEKVSIDKDYNEFLFKRTVVICATIVVVVLIFMGSYMYLNQTVAITLVDKTQAEAEKWLKDNGVKYDIVNVQSNEKPSGTVLTQSIPSGDKIGVLDLEKIEVSTGPNMDEVVDLTGLKSKTKEEIKTFIDSKMLSNASVTSEYSDKVKADRLIRMDFEDDSVTAKNYTRSAKVDFVISKGSREDKKNVKVENFVDQTTDKVYEWNTDTGIMVDEVPVSSDIPVGYIVSQSVAPGTMMGYGDIITLEVSKGPGVYTPNLIGYTIDDATAIAEKSKIPLEPTEKYSDGTAGYIIDQSMYEGESFYPDEDTLNVTVSLGQPFINDMSGSSLGDAVAMINELNTQGANLTYSTKNVKLTADDKEQGMTSGMIKSISNSNSFVSPGANITIEVYS